MLLAVRENGFLDVYDLFRNLQKPVLQQQVFNTSACTCMDLDSTGKYVLVATRDGLVAYIQLSENLAKNPSQAQDKYERWWLQQMFEREQMREKFLEQRAGAKH